MYFKNNPSDFTTAVDTSSQINVANITTFSAAIITTAHAFDFFGATSHLMIALPLLGLLDRIQFENIHVVWPAELAC